MEELIEIKAKVTAKQLIAIAKILNKGEDKFIIKGSDINVQLKSESTGGESGKGGNG